MGQKFSNNYITTLTANIAAGDLLLPVASVAGLPPMVAGDYFYGAIVNSSNAVEFFIATSISGSNLVIPAGGRGIGGSTAIGYTSGDFVRLVLIDGALQQLQQESCQAIATTGTDVYAANYTPVIRGLVNGCHYFLTIANTNTVAVPTVSFNGGAAVNVTLTGGAALGAGQIPRDGIYKYDGTRLILINPIVGTLPSGASIDYMGTVIPSGFLAEDGSNQLRATFANLFAALVRTAVATITIANPGVVTWNAHGLSNSDVVKFSTSGALPTGLTAGTTYFVVSAAANTFSLAATEGGAAINTTGAQSGVHTAIHAPHGDGDGSTTFTLPDSRRRTLIGRGGTPSATIGAGLGATGGEEAHTLTLAEIPNATGAIATLLNSTTGSGVFSTGGVAGGGGSDSGGGGNRTINFSLGGGGGTHNNMPPSLVVTRIIKT